MHQDGVDVCTKGNNSHLRLIGTPGFLKRLMAVSLRQRSSLNKG